tara:strand:- start:2564 stop:3052 length:489 start_codon:yes stop_codon:yes gene_type:complete
MSQNKTSYDVGKQGEADSWSVMREYGYVRPTPQQRRNIVAAYAHLDKEIKAKGFDLIKASDSPLVDDVKLLTKDVESLKLYELKTAGKKRKSPVKDNWAGLGFTLTGAEKHNAETLGGNFKFLFLNLKNNAMHQCNLEDFFASEVANTYPTWSVFITKGLTD